MTKSQVWFQVFLAALQALLSSGVLAPHEASALARSHADEAIQHLNPGVFDIETGKITRCPHCGVSLFAGEPKAPEDEMEQARRQATPSGPTVIEQAEDDVSRETR